MRKLMLAAACSLWFAPAFADEVVIHHDGPDAAPAATSTTVEKHVSDDGCASKTVHKEDDMGDSKTVHQTNCD